MKNPLYFILLSAIVFALGAVGARMQEKKGALAKATVELKSFKPSQYPLKNHPFVIVVVGVNNGASIEKTLASVFSQNYDNYRLIYIDDASNDGSFDLARDAICDSTGSLQVTIVQNEERLGNLANIYRAVQDCSDEEIVVILHGEDFLAHEWVLQRLNAYYADPDLWMAASKSIDFPTFEIGQVFDPIQAKSRQKTCSGVHLKSFYAGLFKKIREADFIYSGTFLPACAEFAYMTPMLEMASNHFHFIPEVLYVRNQNGIYKEDRELQLRSEKWIRSLEPYPEIASLEVSECGD